MVADSAAIGRRTAAKALHLKLDELIRAVGSARNRLVDLESCTDEEIAALEKEFHRLRERAGHQADPSDEAGQR